jgi:hypothetical protein
MIVLRNVTTAAAVVLLASLARHRIGSRTEVEATLTGNRARHAARGVIGIVQSKCSNHLTVDLERVLQLQKDSGLGAIRRRLIWK